MKKNKKIEEKKEEEEKKNNDDDDGMDQGRYLLLVVIWSFLTQQEKGVMTLGWMLDREIAEQDIYMRTSRWNSNAFNRMK